MRFLFRPIDIASLTFFRLVYGLLAFIETMALWTYYHLYEDIYDPTVFRFPYFGFEWVRPFPEPFMSLFFLVMAASALGVFLGKWYRTSATIFAISFIYTFLLEKALYLNHGYLFCWLSVLMIFLPTNRAFSLDVAKTPGFRLQQIPYWPLFVLQFFMGVVYFYGGLAKINPDWLQAMPLKLWMDYKKNYFLIGPLISQDWVAWFMAYGGLALDLFVVFFLLFRRTRLYALGFVLFFHLTNTLIFQIGIFPWLSIALSLLFFEPDLPRRWVEGLRKRFKQVDRWAQAWQQRLAGHPPATYQSIWQSQYQVLIQTVLAIVMAFHLLYPFRHHLIPGDVAWTEEGHRFSWRMMLRSKIGTGSFKIKDPKTNESFTVRPKDYLNDRQARKVMTHPDMILQFAHFLEEEFRKKGHEEVEIYVDVKVALNGRKYQRYIDPAVDLTEIEWSWFEPASWIMPMENSQPIAR